MLTSIPVRKQASPRHPSSRLLPVGFPRNPFAEALKRDRRAHITGSALLAATALLWLCPQQRAAAEAVPFLAQTVNQLPVVGAKSVHAADLDGDGDLDLISASNVDDRIRWFRNLGGLQLVEQNAISIDANGASSVFAADIDGDGDLDVVTASTDNDTVAWYENELSDGLSINTRRIIANDLDGAYSVHAADINGDGHVDVLAAGQGATAGVRVYRNDGAAEPAFTTSSLPSSSAGASSVHTADLDDDGDLDVLVAQFANDSITAFVNDGNPVPVFTSVLISNQADGARSVYAGDIDGDGRIDVVSASRDDNKIAWYRNNGLLSFSETEISTDARSARSVFVADVNGDGTMDVLSASLSDDKIAWYEFDGGFTFETHIIATDADGASSVFAGDMDGDGDADVLSASQFDNTIALYENRATHRSATFAVDPVTQGGSIVAADAGALFTADIRGRGRAEILVPYRNGEFYYYENDFRFPNLYTRRLIANASQPLSTHAADLDGDGDQDVILGTFNNDGIQWYRNAPNPGGFGGPVFTRFAIDDGVFAPNALATADLDGDGDIDVIGANSDTVDTVTWYENDGGEMPSFTPNLIDGSIGAPYSVQAIDMEGDGDIDVVAASKYDDQIHWYENNGAADPVFTERVVSNVATSVRSVFAIDLDRDGDMDVLSASGNPFSFRSARPAIAASAEGQFVTPLGRKSRGGATAQGAAKTAAAGGKDRTVGRPVLNVSEDGNEIVWYENDGQQIFTERLISNNVSDPLSVKAGDLDGDGDLDVVSASYANQEIAWYENNGAVDPVFSQRILKTDMAGAFAVDLADLDRDGDLDVVAAGDGEAELFQFTNNGGQFRFQEFNIAPQTVASGQEDVPVMAIQVEHLGEPGDNDIRVQSLDLKFREGIGQVTIDTAPANALIDNLVVYRDDGDQEFNPAVDAPILVIDQLDFLLEDGGFDSGVQRVVLNSNDGSAQISVDDEFATFFIGVDIAPDANLQMPSQFTIAHLRDVSVVVDAITSGSLRAAVFAGDPFTEVLIAPGPGANDGSPVPFTFTDVSNVRPGSVQTSAPITVLGINIPVRIAVNGGSYSIGCTGSFNTRPSTVTVNQTVCVRHTAAASFDSSVTTTLTIGDESDGFSSTTDIADTTPEPFLFAPAVGVVRGSEQTSNEITVAGINTSVPLSVTGGMYSVNGLGFTSQPGMVVNNDRVRVRHTASVDPSEPVTTTLRISTVTGSFTSTTASGDTDPIPFDFRDFTGVSRNTVQTSAAVPIAGIEGRVAVSVTGGSFSINGGGFRSTPTTLRSGDQVRLRHTSSPDFSTDVSTVLTVGSGMGTFTSRTLVADTRPNAFNFINVTDVDPESLQTSNEITVSGINTAAPISVMGGKYSKNTPNGPTPFTEVAGTVVNGDVVRVQHSAANRLGITTTTTLNIGGITDTFSSTTRPPDITPDAFSFTNVTGVAPGSTQTSNTLTLRGTQAPSPISVSAGSSYSIGCTGIFTTAASMISPDATVCVRHTASTQAGATVTTTLTIGGVPGTFRSTTLVADTTPNAFSFTDVTGVTTGSVQTSNIITLGGTNASSPISVTGGTYSIGCTANFTGIAAFVMPGATVCVRHTASTVALTTVTTTLSIGGVSDAFSSTTRGTAPVTPQVSFATASMSVQENVGTALVRVQLSAPAEQSVTVPMSFAGTATRGASTTPNGDYQPVTTSAVIPAGQRMVDFQIRIVNDTRREGAETIRLTLGTPTNATLGSVRVHTLTIQAND
ncbi:MAG: FG-GAP-like repeat-containing protein [Panacagrimonas sp.]